MKPKPIISTAEIRNSVLPTIGPESAFYGYIIGLSVGLTDWEDLGTDPIDRRLYAMFEYNTQRTTWIVPDEELFKLLSEHLCGMAWIRKNTDEYGYDKLWIEKRDAKWLVELP